MPWALNRSYYQLPIYGPCVLGLGAILKRIGNIMSMCFGLRSGLTTNWQYSFLCFVLRIGLANNWKYTDRVPWAYERFYNQLALYDPCALGLETVLQPIRRTRSVSFGLRSGLTTNWQYTVSVPWA